MHILTNIIDSL